MFSFFQLKDNIQAIKHQYEPFADKVDQAQINFDYVNPQDN